KAVDDKAFKILDKAIGDVFSSENVGVYFEGIAFGLKKPEDIFTIPVFKLFRGGFVFINKDKYQVELGTMKTISDGKLMVVVDEQSKTMLLDSVNKNTPKEISSQQLEALVKDDFKSATLTYEGIETINNHQCHKIKSIVKNGTSSSDVIYWVDTTTGQLYLMGENQNGEYNVYWLSKVGKAPENFNYSIHLPKNKLSTYHGYSVVDNRYSSEEN
ncbi:MAG: hypothetical protein ACXVPY_13230, partial [Bacteroidia bacterium]